MGAIEFIIYTSKINLGIDFTNTFMNMKNRGPNETNYITDNNINVKKGVNLALYLNRDEIMKYIDYSVIYGYHRLSINDCSFNGSQPFEDPIMCNILKYPELRKRPKRRLLCNGEIYNYNELVKGINENKNLQSKSDVEVILGLYLENIDKNILPLDSIKDVIDKLDGEWTFVLTENIDTFRITETNIFIGRDIFGTRPLYYVEHKKISPVYMFISEIKGLPRNILDNSNYTIKEFPIGHLWSFKDGFIKYYDWNKFKELDYCTINNLSGNQIEEVYKNIQETIAVSVQSRIFTTNENKDIGILLSGGFDSSLITALIAKVKTPEMTLHTFSLVRCEKINKSIDNFIESLEKLSKNEAAFQK